MTTMGLPDLKWKKKKLNLHLKMLPTTNISGHFWTCRDECHGSLTDVILRKWINQSQYKFSKYHIQIVSICLFFFIDKPRKERMFVNL